MKKQLSGTVFSFLLIVHLAFSFSPAYAAEKIRVSVLFFNDLHGNLVPFEIKEGDKKVEVGGIARVAALVSKIRAENLKNGIKTLVLFAGVLLQYGKLLFLLLRKKHRRQFYESINKMPILN